MSSLHARRSPKLEQGERLRQSKRAAGLAHIKGGGSLRRPPGIDASTSMAGAGSGGPTSRCCNLRRKIISAVVVISMVFLYLQMRTMFGIKSGKSTLGNIGPGGLRGNRNLDATDAESREEAGVG